MFGSLTVPKGIETTGAIASAGSSAQTPANSSTASTYSGGFNTSSASSTICCA